MVDDEQVVRDVVTNVLEIHGYAVDTAKDSSEALERVAANAYDVVLTDLRMPGELDGMGLFNRIREGWPVLAHRVVFMTGDIVELQTFHELDRLNTKYVKKPFDIRELARIVNEVARRPLPAPDVGADATSG